VVAGHLPLFFVFGFLAILTAVVQIQYDWEYIAWKSEFK
jgi:hypothetical protein